MEKLWKYNGKNVNVKVVQIKFPTKKFVEHMSISPVSGTRGLQRFAFLKYYNALK